LAPLLETVRCSYCSHFRPRFRIHALASGQAICDYCLDWHNHATEFLGGSTTPRDCQACGLTWETLRDSTAGVEVRMWVVMKDGIYQLLCKGCVAPYVVKRADLYKGTQFGREELKI
jgi:hypothetical protein